MLVFAGNQTPTVSWIKDDKHMGLRLRNFKVFPYLFPFPFQGSVADHAPRTIPQQGSSEQLNVVPNHPSARIVGIINRNVNQ